MSAVLVTGVTDTLGAGFAAARRVAAEGHHVIVGAPQRAAAEMVAARLRAEGFAASPLRLDANDPEALPVIAAELTTRFGAIDEIVDGGDPEAAAALRVLLRPLRV